MSSSLLTAPVELSDTELDAVAAGWGSCNPCDNGISVKADVSANVCLASPTGRTSRVEPTRSCELEAPKWGLAASAEVRRTCVGRFHLRAGSDAMSLTNRFKQRRANFIAALARDHDSGLGELFRLYWLSGMDAADLFFEKFGPGAFRQEHMEAEKKSILGKMQTIVLDYAGQFPGLPKAHRDDLETLAGTFIDAAFDARLAERHKAVVVARRLALRPRAQRHAEARI